MHMRQPGRAAMQISFLTRIFQARQASAFDLSFACDWQLFTGIVGIVQLVACHQILGRFDQQDQKKFTKAAFHDVIHRPELSEESGCG